LFKLLPSEIPLIVSLAKLEFGIALKPKVKVSLPASALIVKPWFKCYSKFKLS